MDSAVEGVGEMVTGLAAARTVEPCAGEPHGHGEFCLNCRTPLVGNFCYECGQSGHVHRSMAAFGHDLLHGVFHFEGKIFRTLPMLAWRPGELTRRYIDGERAKFVSPIALFLFSVFLMFAAISWLGGPFSTGGVAETSAEARAEAAADQRRDRAQALAKLKDLERELNAARKAGTPTAEIEEQISGQRMAMKLKQDAFELQTRLANQEEKRDAAAAAPEESARREAEPVASVNDALDEDPTGIPWLNHAIEKWQKNPSLLLYKLQSNAYKFSWALIPISVPFVWLLFLHKRRYRRAFHAYDHVVFVTYSIAFMSLGFILLTLIRPLAVGQSIAGIAMVFVPPLHMYRQLRGAYSLSGFSALWRTIMLLIFSFVAGTIFFSLLLVLGVLG
ncbi:DUF3667 domain-containing protein [Sphingosinicella sp. BN140058]|uniref:DUF3667 domain-containing protein n=1 Tax=Sphingosinicella sp. BN140058 TaxID=1892855 RepID=UPI0010121E95|nr:DUF3667 domain-containing protein [Sphingosinicella sp. BN140058]QAY75652.1 DUF3667 domain-containing protein [Sphingosinicella sp. BN140058]